MIGRTIAHYEILQKIGQGGMGEVYLARDTKLDREIAVKILPPDLAARPDRRKRFEREAKAVAALSHPNIVTIYSVEDVDDTLLLTMEMVDGKTLDRVTPREGLPLERFFDLGTSLTDAVSYAHRKGITHRDLKPGNIMVDGEGRLKVLDFGLAKLLETEVSDDSATTRMADSATQEGVVLGTVAYMSPEQAEGKPLDHRTDIFSLGIVLYEMATGRRPFGGDTRMSTISAILRSEPESVTQLRQNLPPHLGRIIKKCLQKDAEKRYQTAADLRNDLQGLRDEMNSGDSEVRVPERPRGRLRRTHWMAYLFGVIVVAALGFGLTRLLDRDQLPSSDSSSALTQMPVTSSGNVESVGISADGSFIAFVTRVNDVASLRVKQLATGSEVEILSPSGRAMAHVEISPNGQYIFYHQWDPDAGDRAEVDICRIPILGGTPRRVLKDVAGTFALSPDGEWIAFYRSDETHRWLMVASVDGSDERSVRDIGVDAKSVLAWAPDGKSLISTALVSDPGASWVLTEIDVADGAVLRKGSSRWTSIMGMRWHPDGRIIISGRSGLQRFQDSSQLWQLASLDAEPQLLLGGLQEYIGLSLEGSGNVAATVAATIDQSIWIVPMSNPGQKRRIDYTSRVGFWPALPAWTHDGRILVEHREGEALHIRSLSTDGAESVLLTTVGPFNMCPTVSPRGDMIAYSSNRSGAMKIYLADKTGGDVRRLTDDDVEELFPAFDTTGEYVYYHAHDATEQGFHIRKAPVRGGPSVRLSEQQAWLPSVSPDGSRLLVQTVDADGNTRLAILPAEGGDLQLLELENVNHPRWDPDGVSLTCWRYETGEGSIWKVPVDRSEPLKLVSFPGEEFGVVAWSPGGDSLAVLTNRMSQDAVLVRGLARRSLP